MPAHFGKWVAPQIWEGGTCYLLAGGPSLNEVDLERLRGAHCIAVNHAYLRAPWADAMFFHDFSFFHDFVTANSAGVARARKRHPDIEPLGLNDFPGIKVTTNVRHEDKADIRLMKKINAPSGIFSGRGSLCFNRSSGGAVVNLAVHFGAKRIVLLGYDMRKVGIVSNWHEDKPRKKAYNPYKYFLGPWSDIARDLKRRGVECINATPGSALKEFPVVSPDEVYPPFVGPVIMSKYGRRVEA